METYYYDDKKEKHSSHEITLKEHMIYGYNPCVIDIHLDAFGYSKEDAFNEFCKARTELIYSLNDIIKQVEKIELKDIPDKA